MAYLTPKQIAIVHILLYSIIANISAYLLKLVYICMHVLLLTECGHIFFHSPCCAGQQINHRSLLWDYDKQISRIEILSNILYSALLFLWYSAFPLFRNSREGPFHLETAEFRNGKYKEYRFFSKRLSIICTTGINPAWAWAIFGVLWESV